MDSIWSWIGLAAAALTSTSFLPQIVTQLRHPDRARVSYGTLGAFILGAFLWAAYGVHLGDRIIIGANGFILSNLLFLLGLQIYRDLKSR